MPRFCLTLQLRPDPDLIAEYTMRHRQVWPEVLQALHAAGVLDMQIFRTGDRLFMVMDTEEGFSFERKAVLDRENAQVMAWEREMARYQLADPDSDASRRWMLVEPLFSLREAMDAGEQGRIRPADRP